ncbi:MAG: Rab family GTPase [Planctomycetota bacterium]
MIQRKVCLMGAYAVGKTSLVSRFVHSLFADKYQTTIGVKIDRKTLRLEATEVSLVVWDLAGEDRFHRVEASYTRGASGLLLVADGCRAETVDRALELDDRARGVVGEVPRILALNKADLAAEWEVGEEQLQVVAARELPIVRTSAKVGDGVELAFRELARRMLEFDPA